MATTFSLRLARAPIRGELETLLDERDLMGLEEVPEVWADGWFVHPYVPGISTRGLEVGPEDGVFTVRVLSNAAPEELAMAVRLVAGLARHDGCTIQREGSGDLDADTFLATFDAAWVARTVDEEFAKLRVVAAVQTISLPGPTRTVSFGPATLARVGPGPEPLLRVMRDVLYPNGPIPDDEAGVLYVSKPTRLTRAGREIVVHVVGPGVHYFLSACDVYALIGEPSVHIAASALPALAPDAVTPVDEASVRLSAIEGDAWEELLDRARPVGHADAFDAAPPVAVARPEGTNEDPADGSLATRGETPPPVVEPPAKAGASPAVLFLAAVVFVIVVAIVYGMMR